MAHTWIPVVEGHRQKDQKFKVTIGLVGSWREARVIWGPSLENGQKKNSQEHPSSLLVWLADFSWVSKLSMLSFPQWTVSTGPMEYFSKEVRFPTNWNDQTWFLQKNVPCNIKKQCWKEFWTAGLINMRFWVCSQGHRDIQSSAALNIHTSLPPG